jgi:hypothetical protein
VVYDGPPGGFTREHARLVYRGGDSGRARKRDDGDEASSDVAPEAGPPDLRLVRG